jgi:hypothetical protein
MRKGALICGILAVLLLLGGCGHLQSGTLFSQQQEKSGLYDIAIPDDIEKEMESLAAGMIVYSTDQERALVHLKMAVLCSHYKNPSPDYARALEELNIYMDLDPVGATSNEILQFRHYLATIAAVKNDNRKLESTVKELKQDVAGMKETLEKLKSLDVMMEEKRRKVQ